MPGNAFQRNAFQRNAFQIVYEFEPTIDGGLVLGGNVTTRFSTHRTAVVSGGLVLGGNVTARFRPGEQHYLAIPSGGLVLGGNVRARFQSGARPRRLGTAGRVWYNILRRPRKYKAKVSGGLVLGRSNVRTGLLRFTPISVYNEVTLFTAKPSGGLVLGGSVETQFISLPVFNIDEGLPISQPIPDPVSYKAVSTLGGGVGSSGVVSGGVRARFQSNPPPPAPSTRSWGFFNSHKAQQLEEDELLLMEIL